MTTDVMAMAREFDGRDDFRDVLTELYECERCDRKLLNAARIKRVLRRPKLFERVYSRAVEDAATALVAATAAGTFAANGDFAKWFLTWLENVDWDKILKIIQDIIQLFG